MWPSYTVHTGWNQTQNDQLINEATWRWCEPTCKCPMSTLTHMILYKIWLSGLWLFASLNFGQVTDRQTYIQKAMHMSPQCIRTGGLNKLIQKSSSECRQFAGMCIVKKKMKMSGFPNGKSAKSWLCTSWLLLLPVKWKTESLLIDLAFHRYFLVFFSETCSVKSTLNLNAIYIQCIK